MEKVAVVEGGKPKTELFRLLLFLGLQYRILAPRFGKRRKKGLCPKDQWSGWIWD